MNEAVVGGDGAELGDAAGVVGGEFVKRAVGVEQVALGGDFAGDPRAAEAWGIKGGVALGQAPAFAVVVSEYHLATGDNWVLPELQEIHDHLAKAQYLHMSQINPKATKSHPDSYPKGPENAYGGWGHNPGFEGYGPIAMLTGQGALAYSLMHRCGIKIDREKMLGLARAIAAATPVP